MVKDPFDCLTCQTLYCKTCIKNRNCLKCGLRSFKTSKLISRDLKKLLFTCKSCLKSINYDFFPSHVTLCCIKLFPKCPLTCGNKEYFFKPQRMYGHLKDDCPNTKMVCKICGDKVSRVKSVLHKCNGYTVL